MYTVSTIISTAIHTHVTLLITSKKRQSKLLLFTNSRKRFQPLSPFLRVVKFRKHNRVSSPLSLSNYKNDLSLINLSTKYINVVFFHN